MEGGEEDLAYGHRTALGDGEPTITWEECVPCLDGRLLTS